MVGQERTDDRLTAALAETAGTVEALRTVLRAAALRRRVERHLAVRARVGCNHHRIIIRSSSNHRIIRSSDLTGHKVISLGIDVAVHIVIVHRWQIVGHIRRQRPDVLCGGR